MNRWGHRRGFVMKNNHMTICNRVGCAQQHVMITAGHSEQRLPLLVATVSHLRVEGLAVDVVEVSRAHLLRQRARPAQEPPRVVRQRLGAAARPAPRKAKSLPHLDPPVAAVEQHAGAADYVADDAVADVQRRDAQHPERREAQQRERDGVHVGVAEHAEEGARQGEAPGRRRVAAAIEHAAGPLGLDHDVPSGGGVHL